MSNVDASLKKVGANTKKQTSLDRADKFKKYKKKHTPNNKVEIMLNFVVEC